MRKILILFIVLLCATAFAQQATAPTQATTTTVTQTERDTAPATSSKPRIDIGAGYWWTGASLDTKLVAVDALPGYYLKGDKISELNYNTDAGLIVINADAYLFWRLYADAMVGWGNIKDGSQIDSDWLWRISTQKWLESKASADGKVRTWGANAHFRILEEPQEKGFLDVSLGYLYYQDNIDSMSDLVYRIVDWTPVNDPYPGLDSSDKYTFDGVRLGARARIRLHERFAVKLNGGIMPWLKAKRDGYWNLREMDISGDADANGYDLNISLEFKITQHLFVEAGYKYMYFDTDKGDYSHTIGGIKQEFEDGWDSTEADRGGFYLMGRLKI